MALSSINLTLPAVATNASEVKVTNASGGVPFPSLTATQAAIATAAADSDVQASGTAPDKVTAITTALDALTSSMTGDVALIFDPAVLTTPNKGRAVLATLEARLKSMGLA